LFSTLLVSGQTLKPACSREGRLPGKIIRADSAKNHRFNWNANAVAREKSRHRHWHAAVAKKIYGVVLAPDTECTSEIESWCTLGERHASRSSFRADLQTGPRAASENLADSRGESDCGREEEWPQGRLIANSACKAISGARFISLHLSFRAFFSRLTTGGGIHPKRDLERLC
jgi:hypothetical protein